MDTCKVKICGLTTMEDARFCAGAGADFIGFVQHPESPRYVEPAHVADILEWVAGPRPVGVFVNRSAEEINRTSDRAGFELVQLHGDEPPRTCAAVDRPVIKAFRVEHDASVEQLERWIEPYVDHVDYLLLDTHHTDLWGGTGESFNWRVARELSIDLPLFLAGGIGAENVREAIDRMRPYAVDLSSSVEEEPGEKSFEKMEQFFDAFDAARTALAENS